MSAPTGIPTSAEGIKGYLPSRCVHEYAGHAKGVANIKLFPKTAHLLLSAGLDGKVKLWDASGANGYKLFRTYDGHAKGVRQVGCKYKPS